MKHSPQVRLDIWLGYLTENEQNGLLKEVNLPWFGLWVVSLTAL